MGKVFVKMLEIPLGNKFWDASDFERVKSSLEKNKNKWTRIFFSIVTILRKLKIFLKLLVVHANFHEKVQICQFEHLKAPF